MSSKSLCFDLAVSENNAVLLGVFFGESKSRVDNSFLLYLPTQVRFSIGGERVMCHGLKLTF